MEIKINDIVKKKYASEESDYTKTFKVVEIKNGLTSLICEQTGLKHKIYSSDLINFKK